MGPTSRSEQLLRWRSLAGTILVVLVLLAAWQYWAETTPRRAFLFSHPAGIAASLLEDVVDGTLLVDVGITATEVVLGLVISTLLGTAAGLLACVVPQLAFVVRPWITVVGAVPVVAIAPLLIIWFGTGLAGKVLIAAFACAGVAFGQAFEGAREAERAFGRLARSLKASKWHTVRYFLLPSAAGWVQQGAAINVGLATLGAFTAEFISSEAGLGHHILRSAGRYDTARVLGGVLLLAAFCLALTSLVRGAIAWFVKRL